MLHKFIGFLLFLIISISGFWCIIFFTIIIPYWIFGYLKIYENEKNSYNKWSKFKPFR
ncbi:hypothetical protein DMIN_00120 [Candidatus Karelsulcia muelleri DMIN]|uniref:Uncharacterized protein n=1 Tax=Karelsulcia muelleri (strain DMIN) TaxID=641892 RepID=D5D8F2_KARMD|nr:hypothetical protein DMIN_00120 [Candidatus Karelsulcia muelleri DMIN]